MLYDTSKSIDKQRAIQRFEHLINSSKVLELKEKKNKRSYSQNNYFHLIISWYALEYGDPVEEVKQQLIKREICPDIFITPYVNRKTGEEKLIARSSASLDTGEMTTVIDRFRNYASKVGIYLPEPDDLNFLNEIELEIENNKQYL